MKLAAGVCRVFRAVALGSRNVPSLSITARESFPEGLSLTDARALHTREGRELAEALIASLPGGTLDQVLIALLEHQASALQVPYPAQERIWCMHCGKSVSSPVPAGTVVRAWVECPECIEKKPTPPASSGGAS